MQAALEPLHRLPLTELWPEGVQDVVANPNGPTVYAMGFERLVDVVALAAMYWGWLIGAAAALVATFLVWRVLVILARPQRRGMPHCRRCNYDLTAHAPGPDGVPKPCPECGRALTGARAVRTGRSTRRRMVPLAIPAGILVALGALAVALGLGWRADVGEWPSRFATRVVERLGITLPQGSIHRCSTIVEVDLANGQILRTVVGAGAFYGVAVDPTGESILLSQPQAAVARVSARTGRELGRMEPPEARGPGAAALPWVQECFCGFSRDGTAAFIMFAADTTPPSTRVVRWSFADGSQATVANVPSYVDPQRGGAWPRQAHVLPGENGGPDRILSRADFMEAFPTRTYPVAIHTGPGEPVLKGDLGTQIESSSNGVLSPDGKRMYFVAAGMGGVIAIDMTDLSVIGTVPAPGAITGHRIAIDPAGRLLAVGGFGGIAVRDTEARVWTTSLAMPHDLYGGEAGFSSDGRYAFARAQWGTGSGQWRHELLVWDIATLRKKGADGPGGAGKP
jgi:hypothetical protein